MTLAYLSKPKTILYNIVLILALLICAMLEKYVADQVIKKINSAYRKQQAID